MREHPILFSGEMVRAILEGRKTQTRRVISDKVLVAANIGLIIGDGSSDSEWPAWCPYGKPGDRLWVRETFKANEYRKPNDPTLKNHFSSRIAYRADGHTLQKDVHMEGWLLWLEEGWSRWRPSIHMPRWASRINLEITGIRVEPVQEITREDVLAEGLRPLGYGRATEPQYCTKPFSELWDSINAKRGYGWAENPWVWVVEFRVLHA